LIDPLTKSFISLGLDCYETLHETLQVGFGLRRWRGCVIGSSILETSSSWDEVKVLVERIRATLPTLISGSRAGIILW